MYSIQLEVLVNILSGGGKEHYFLKHVEETCGLEKQVSFSGTPQW